MNASLLYWGGQPSINKERLYFLMFKAIGVAVYGKVNHGETQTKHIEYLVNLSYQYLIRDELTVTTVLLLHKNIMPPSVQGVFIYDGEEKIENVSPGVLRDIDTYLIFEGVEYDFVKHIHLEEMLVKCIASYVNSKKEVEDILRFYLEMMLIHPFRDGNGKTIRVLLEVLLIKNNIYPPLFGKAYFLNKKLFIKIQGDYLKGNKEKALKDFMYSLLYKAYKPNYF